jgi:hypothetical protein
MDSKQPTRPLRRIRVPEGAFVIQVWAESETGLGQAAGTIEHVSSGAVTTFASAAELWRFMCQMMASLRRAPP